MNWREKKKKRKMNKYCVALGNSDRYSNASWNAMAVIPVLCFHQLWMFLLFSCNSMICYFALCSGVSMHTTDKHSLLCYIVMLTSDHFCCSSSISNEMHFIFVRWGILWCMFCHQQYSVVPIHCRFGHVCVRFFLPLFVMRTHTKTV